MTEKMITCPHCGYSKSVSLERIPERPSRAICPRCRNHFSFSSDIEGTEDGGEPFHSPGSSPVLRDLVQLFRDSWDLYLNRIGSLMGLYLLAVGMLMAPVALFGGLGALAVPFAPDFGPALIGAGVITGCVVGSFGLFWGIAGLVCAVADSRLGVRAALSRAGERYWSFLWVFGLVGYLMSGGFLLFVIPGLVFSAWFAFSQFILADEDVRGMDALMKSKGYTAGHFFEILARLIILWIVSSLLGMVPVAGSFLSILVVPYMMIFTYLIYVDLRVGGRRAVSTAGRREKAIWLLVGTLGYILVPAGGLFLFGAALMQSALHMISGM